MKSRKHGGVNLWLVLLVVLETEPRYLLMLVKCSVTELYPQPIFPISFYFLRQDLLSNCSWSWIFSFRLMRLGFQNCVIGPYSRFFYLFWFFFFFWERIFLKHPRLASDPCCSPSWPWICRSPSACFSPWSTGSVALCFCVCCEYLILHCRPDCLLTAENSIFPLTLGGILKQGRDPNSFNSFFGGRK